MAYIRSLTVIPKYASPSSGYLSTKLLCVAWHLFSTKLLRLKRLQRPHFTLQWPQVSGWFGIVSTWACKSSSNQDWWRWVRLCPNNFIIRLIRTFYFIYRSVQYIMHTQFVHNRKKIWQQSLAILYCFYFFYLQTLAELVWNWGLMTPVRHQAIICVNADVGR